MPMKQASLEGDVHVYYCKTGYFGIQNITRTLLSSIYRAKETAVTTYLSNSVMLSQAVSSSHLQGLSI